MLQDDVIHLIDDDEADSLSIADCWQVLVVDDDEDVHSSTDFALRRQLIQGRRLHLLHARSGKEAELVLRNNPNIAAIFLDVVMETESAGLDLIGFIRETLHLSDVRIILRTGQPGYAPELEVFTRYDINDYRTKSELTQLRLVTTLIAAIRSYEQIVLLTQHRRSMEQLMRTVDDLIERETVPSFVQGIFTHVAALLHQGIDGGFSWRTNKEGGWGQWHVLRAAGSALLRDEVEVPWQDLLVKGRQLSTPYFEAKNAVLVWRSTEQEAVVVLHGEHAINPREQQLLKVLTAYLSACFGRLVAADRITNMANQDVLTGLCNRRGLLNAMTVSIERHQNSALWLLDLARFSDINDGLGQTIGNYLLQAVAQRLQQILGIKATIARISTDVFAVFDVSQQLGMPDLLEAFEHPFQVDGHIIPLSVALGCCYGEDSGGDSTSWLNRATIALNWAKKNPAERVDVFRPVMEEDTRTRLDILSELRRAFDNHELQLWFQPQTSVLTEEVIGVEGLLRWPDGKGGFVYPPSVFIPLAEYSGLILEIGRWVLEEACRFIQTLQQKGWTNISVAANVSLPQFRNTTLLEDVRELLKKYAIPSGLLDLEITESIAMDNPRVIASRLQQLKDLGVLISMDDFGTGYSSLGYLQQLPIDRLKIDRSFVMEMETDRGRSLAETIVTLAHRLGLSVLAEGVETTRQLEYLRALGCEHAQGFLYAKAMPAPELLEWMERRKTQDSA